MHAVTSSSVLVLTSVPPAPMLWMRQRHETCAHPATGACRSHAITAFVSQVSQDSRRSGATLADSTSGGTQRIGGLRVRRPPPGLWPRVSVPTAAQYPTAATDRV